MSVLYQSDTILNTLNNASKFFLVFLYINFLEVYFIINIIKNVIL